MLLLHPLTREVEHVVPDLQAGQCVSVNLVGLHVAEVEFGGSTSANGIVEDINPDTKEITVRLNLSFSGQQFLVVSPARVTAN